jgi:hypothetical protein
VNLLNLGLGELLALMGAISAGIVALYLLDRSKRRQRVATLRFWRPAGSRTDLKHQRRIQQPWSLLLQILSTLLLLTAIAGPQFGVFDGPGRNHVVVLDTSAWMAALSAEGVLIDQAKAAARAYLDTLPRRDRVMLVRANALATPATAFEQNRSILEAALRDTQPAASALNLPLALDFARRAQGLQPEAAGEIVFIGAGRLTPEDAELTGAPANLRTILLPVPSENIGIRQASLRRSLIAPDSWDIFLSVRNYGVRTHAVALAVQFAQTPIGSRRLALAPGAEQQLSFTYREKAGGWLEARLNVNDSVPQDDRVVIEVPPQGLLRAIVYSDDLQLRPLFATNPSLETEFRPTAGYDPAAAADLVVLDRFAPTVPPQAHLLWIEPPAGASPVAIRASVSRTALERWNQDSPLGAGIYSPDVVLANTQVFAPAATDQAVASTAEGPVIVARGGARKQVVLGFHPAQGPMRYELATPLLVANLLRWIAPEVYRRVELQATSVGMVTVPVPEEVSVDRVRVLDEGNRALPFTVSDGFLRFFAGDAGAVRVQTPDRELIYSLTLPALEETTWTPPPGAAKGVPPNASRDPAAVELWPWLAIAGALGLLADWILYGRNRARGRRTAAVRLEPATWRKAS